MCRVRDWEELGTGPQTSGWQTGRREHVSRKSRCQRVSGNRRLSVSRGQERAG